MCQWEIQVATKSAGSMRSDCPIPYQLKMLAAASVQAELWILVGKDLRLRSPEPVRGLQAVHGVGGAEFARLHDEGEQARGQAQKEERIPQLRPPA